MAIRLGGPRPRHALTRVTLALAASSLVALAAVGGCTEGGTVERSGVPADAFTKLAEASPTLDDLVSALASSPDSSERAEAARLLGERGDPVGAQAVHDALEDDAEEVRIAAAGAVGALGHADAVGTLLTMVSSGSGAERKAALAAVASIGEDALPRLTTLANGKDREIALAAIDSLAALGRSAVPALLELLGSDDAKIRSTAANRLGRIGDRRAEKPLAALLGDSGMGKTASMALARLYKGEATRLVHYLGLKKTVGIYYGMIRLGDSATAGALVTALNKFGTVAMAEDYLNCGNDRLESAAESWARAHGYEVYTVPGAGDGTWGGGFED